MTLATLDEILEILKNRQKHCRDLLDLSHRQNQMIHASDYSQLMTILSQKQRILGRLDEIKRRHPELARQWRSLRDKGLPVVRGNCETILAETEALLAELLQTEKEGAEQLTERRDATRRQLAGVAQGLRVNETYSDSLAPVNHRFLDLNR